MRIIKKQLIISLVIYSISYLIKTFVLFKLTNPFEWIMMIPKLTNEERGLVLFGLIIYYAVCCAWIKIDEDID